MNNPSSNISSTQIEAKKGDIKLQKSLLKRGSEGDCDAIKIMFQQFIPENEKIYDAKYLGIQGFLGVGNRQFACVTERRIANISVGYFGELNYQDGYLEHIHSCFMYKPNFFALYIYIFSTTFFIVIQSEYSSLEELIFYMVLGLILTLILLPFLGKQYYQVFKSGLVLTVREGQLASFPYLGNNVVWYTNRLLYISASRKFLTRTNSLYREFIIRREERLNTVENYPLPDLVSRSEIPELTPLSLSSLPSIDTPENNIKAKIMIGLTIAGLGIGGIWTIANFVIFEQKVNDLVTEGNILQYLEEDYKNSLKAYNQAIELKPQLADAWFEKGNALLSLDRYDEALESYKEATNIDDSYSAAWYNQGIVLKIKLLVEFDEALFDEALNAFENAIRKGDRDLDKLTISDARREKCYLLGEQGQDLSQILRACRFRVVGVDDDYLAWKYLGNIWLGIDQEEALESYLKAVEIKPDYSAAWYNIGIVFRDTGELNKALDAFNKAIEGDGDFGRLSIADGWKRKCSIAIDLSRFKEAEGCNQIGVDITNATVVGDPVPTKNVRVGITTETEVLFELPVRSRVRVIESRVNSDNYPWYKIYSPQFQRTGWIAGHLIKLDFRSGD